eukprot:comp21934_c0_seq1/m.31577 comp21934_c0_seq1/g.31577  ORF comp21934_c0_seq1/g.31577 comp21934_c0_seq1/m.31577 type:complete len:356 (-) comp21934_c0_seq1:760-1827(-)
MMQQDIRGATLASGYKGSTDGNMTIRQFNTSQYDFPGSKSSCTAIACMAAVRFLQHKGKYQQCIYTNDHVMELIAQGVVWHSLWLAAGDGTRSPYSQDELESMSKLSLASSPSFEASNSDTGLPKTPSTDSLLGTSMATPDEVCGLEGMPLKATHNCYAGYLTSGCAFGHTLEQSIRLIFKDDTESKSGWFSGPNETTQEPRKTVQAFVLTTKGYSSLIGRMGQKAIVFDSHKRSHTDGLAYVNKGFGQAILVMCNDADTLIRYLKALYAVTGGGSMYTLQEVELKDEQVCTEPTEGEVEVEWKLGSAVSAKIKRAFSPSLWAAAVSGSASSATGLPQAVSAGTGSQRGTRGVLA